MDASSLQSLKSPKKGNETYCERIVRTNQLQILSNIRVSSCRQACISYCKMPLILYLWWVRGTDNYTGNTTFSLCFGKIPTKQTDIGRGNQYIQSKICCSLFRIVFILHHIVVTQSFFLQISGELRKSWIKD